MYMRDVNSAPAQYVFINLMGQRTNNAKLNWLVYNVGSYVIIVHSLFDRACVAWMEYLIGYLATPVPVGSLHRLYMCFFFFFNPKNNQ